MPVDLPASRIAAAILASPHCGIRIRLFEKLGLHIVRKHLSRHLSFMCASAVYLSLPIPASAAYKEEFLSNQEVARLASTHAKAAPKKTLSSRSAGKAQARNQRDPIADFAQHRIDLATATNHKRPHQDPAS